jgi:hypothetical protein
LVVEGVLKWEWREEGPYGWYEELELGGVCCAGSLVGDVVKDQVLDIFHNLGVAAVRIDSHCRHIGTRGFMDCCGLREEDEWYGEQALHPFNL